MQSLNTLNDYENGLCLFKEALQDQDESERRGVFNGAAQIVGINDHPRHCLHALNADSAADYVLYGVWVKAKTVEFWVNLGSTTEKIIDPVSGNDIEVIAGTLTYSDWDNAYVDAADIDLITVGWHHVVITSSTGVILLTGFNIGKGDIQVTGLRFWADELSANEVAQLYNVKIGGAGLFFNGNGHVICADNDAEDVGEGDFALSAWVKPIGVNGRLIEKAGVDPRYYMALVNDGVNDNVVRVLCDDSVNMIYVDSPSPVTIGHWTHVFATFDRDSVIKVYINGSWVVDSASIAAVGDLNNGNDLLFGENLEGELAYERLLYFGFEGLPTGNDLTALINGLSTDPGGSMTDYGLAKYEDAVYTDLHNGAGSVSGLVIGEAYEFTQGTVGHDLGWFGGGGLTSTGVFTAPETNGVIGSGDGNDHVRRIGERGNWELTGDLADKTSNALDLSHAGSGNIFAKHGSVGPTKEDTVLLLNFPDLTDLSGNGNNGTNHGADIVASGRNSGNALNLISTNSDYIDCGNIGTIKSIVLMLNPDNVTQSILDCDGGSHKITVSGGTITATGFTAFYVDGVISGVLNLKSWQLLVVTDSSGLDASALTFGKEGANYFDGMVDILGAFSMELHMLDIQGVFHRIRRGLLL